MVAITFAGMAMDALEEGKSGLMTAINSGCYSMVQIPDPKLGPRKVEIAPCTTSIATGQCIT